MSDNLILVDEADNVLGFKEKWGCHKINGIKHRAFSIYIFNDKNELLIQKRSLQKKLWPEFWSNSCCSHPRENEEDYVKCAEKRLVEELGFTCKLKKMFKISYNFKFNNIGSENEIDCVLVGKYNGKVKPNPDEVSEFKWISVDFLKKDMEKNKEIYTPWFVIGLKKLVKFF